MAVNKNTFFQYKESRALTGYKSAWLVKNTDGGAKGLYSLVCASETVPYVFGDKETHEFDLLQSPSIGQVEGKTSLEPQDIEVLHHRDNVYRFEQLKGKVLDFMCINAEFVGYKFTGTVDYRPNNAEGDINKATVTITPMSADTTPVYDARPLIADTICFKNAIPATVKVNETVDFEKIQEGPATITVYKIDSATNQETTAVSDSDYSLSDGTKITFRTAGLRAINVSGNTGYAPWTTTVYVEDHTAPATVQED